MPWTNKGKYRALELLFNGGAWTATLKFHLANSTPTVDTNVLSDLTEASNYTSLSYSKNDTDFPTLTEDDTGDLASVAVKPLVFTAGGGTCTATHVVMCDANVTEQNREVLAFWSLGGTQNVSTGQTLTCTAGTLRLTE